MVGMDARVGFIMTEEELVAVKRTGEERNLLVARPIPLTVKGEHDGSQRVPEMTVMLALWVLAMIATRDDGWEFDAAAS